MVNMRSLVELKVASKFWQEKKFELKTTSRKLTYCMPDNGAVCVIPMLAARQTVQVVGWFRIPRRPGARQYRLDISCLGKQDMLQIAVATPELYQAWCNALQTMFQFQELSNHPDRRWKAGGSQGENLNTGKTLTMADLDAMNDLIAAHAAGSPPRAAKPRSYGSPNSDGLHTPPEDADDPRASAGFEMADLQASSVFETAEL